MTVWKNGQAANGREGEDMKPKLFLFGILVIVAGVLLWLDSRGTVNLDASWGRDWPLILVVLGAMGLGDSLSRAVKKRTPRPVCFPLALLIVGLWIWLSHLSHRYEGFADFSFQKNWPLLMIIVGIYIAFYLSLRSKRDKRSRHTEIHIETGGKRREDRNADAADEDIADAEVVGEEARVLKVRVWEKGSEDPKVKVNIPVRLVKWAVNMMPESAREKMREKNVDPDIITEAIEKNMRGTVVNIDEGPNGDRILVTLE